MAYQLHVLSWRLEILHIQYHDAAQWSTNSETTKPTQAPFDFHFVSSFQKNPRFSTRKIFTSRKILQLLKSTYSDKNLWIFTALFATH